MYAISMTTVKSHQFCCRACMKGCCKVQKFSCSSPSMDKIQRRKDWWKNVFGKYLFLTNTISSGILMAVGDLIQQEIEYVKYGKHKNSFDWNRNMNMGIVGTLQGPLAHFFYQILDNYFPGVKMTTIMKKIFLDQTIASPLCIILFFGGMNYLGNKDFEVSKAELKEKFFLVYADIDSSGATSAELRRQATQSVFGAVIARILLNTDEREDLRKTLGTHVGYWDITRAMLESERKWNAVAAMTTAILTKKK